ncbi:unnamed protein product, partial [Porites lobata]
MGNHWCCKLNGFQASQRHCFRSLNLLFGKTAPCSQGLLVFQHDSGKLENEKTLRTTRLTVAFPVISNVCIVHCACFNDASGNPGAHSGNLIPRFYSFSNIPSPYWKTRRPWGRGCSFGPQLFS